jgi:hypothetical protein
MLHDERGKTAGVVVPDKQLSLAIGKEGQNARLAAKLTGWRIDIKSASEAVTEAIQKVKDNRELHDRIVDKLEIFNMASAILNGKDPVDFSEGELKVLSEAVETVNLAEMALRREQKAKVAAEAEAAREIRARDILAEAEAILSGQSPLARGKQVSAEPEEVTEEGFLGEPVAELEEEFEPVPETADVVLETEAAVEAEAEPMAEVVPTEVEEVEAVTAEPEPAAETEAVLPEMEETSLEEPVTVEEGVWQEEEDEEFDPERTKAKQKARKKKRRLVFDENLGEVVAERRRKPNRRSWLEYDEEDE